jgi:hypothetical protein
MLAIAAPPCQTGKSQGEQKVRLPDGPFRRLANRCGSSPVRVYEVIRKAAGAVANSAINVEQRIPA